MQGKRATTTATSHKKSAVVPPYLEINAGGNINFETDIALPPSLREISFCERAATFPGSAIYVSDYNPQSVYPASNGTPPTNPALTLADLLSPIYDTSSPVHLGDPNPIIISAGGNIEDLQLYLPKMAQISAVGNIENIYYSGMNIGVNDVTTISAGGDITFSGILPGQLDSGLQQGGPGRFIVQAGGSIDLGSTAGIQTIGNQNDPALDPTKGCNLIVLAGYGQAADTALQNLDTADSSPTFTGGVVSFFQQLQAAGVSYSKLQAEGDGAEAQQIVDQARNTFIAALNKGETGGAGNIEMTTSQICSLAGQSNTYMFAAGTVDVGKTTFLSANSPNTGIYTASGGGINMYAVGNVNVNESRVMTFLEET